MMIMRIIIIIIIIKSLLVLYNITVMSACWTLILSNKNSSFDERWIGWNGWIRSCSWQSKTVFFSFFCFPCEVSPLRKPSKSYLQSLISRLRPRISRRIKSQIRCFTSWLPAGVEDLQVKRLRAGLLDDRHILPRPLVGSRQSVGPPVRPVDAASEEGNGKGVGEVLVAPEDLHHPAAVVECRENGIGTVWRRPAERVAHQRFKLLLADDALKADCRREQPDQSLPTQTLKELLNCSGPT